MIRNGALEHLLAASTSALEHFDRSIKPEILLLDAGTGKAKICCLKEVSKGGRRDGEGRVGDRLVALRIQLQGEEKI